MAGQERIFTTCKAVTDGETRGRATRFGETMGEAAVATRQMTDSGLVNPTQAKLRIHEDGSGVFILKRGADEITVRWAAEETPLELFAKFGDVEGVLVPDVPQPSYRPAFDTKEID